MKYFERIFCVLFVALGITFYDNESWKWNTLTLLTFSLPAIVFLIKLNKYKVVTYWFAVFILLQICISALYFPQFATLIPNYSHEFIVENGKEVGITGVQKVTTDSKGFRTLNSIQYSDFSKYRIIAIGGSTTESIWIDDKKTWPAILESMINNELKTKAEIINTGVSGLATPDHLNTLRNVIKYKPDMILFLFGVNDWNREILRHFDKSLANEQEGQWCLRRSLIGRVLRQFYFKMTTKNETNKIGIQSYSLKIDNQNKKIRKSYISTGVSDEYKKNTSKIVNICNKYSLNCIFINQPNAYEQPIEENILKNKIWMNPPYTDYSIDISEMRKIANLYNAETINTAQNNKLGYCDIASASKEVSEQIFYDDCHFNLLGSSWMAMQVFDCIKSNLHRENTKR